MISKDFKWPQKPPMTSKDKKDKPVSRNVKSKNSLKGGAPIDDNPFNGRDIFEQPFFPKTWLSLWKL